MKRLRRSRSRATFVASMIGLLALAVSFDRLPQSGDVRRQLWGLNQANFHEFREMLQARKLPELDARFSFRNGRPDADVVSANFTNSTGGDTAIIELVGNSRIYYTLDGSIPTKRSPVYRQPIRLTTNAVVRARHLPRSTTPGAISTWHHIRQAGHDLPIISMVMDPVDLWNKYVGLYENPFGRGRRWERSAHVALQLPSINAVTLFEAEARIHGGYSRYAEKKSFRLRFDIDSLPSLPNDLLVSTAVDGENTIVLRTTIQPAAQIRDALATALYADLGNAVSTGHPVELLLNGEYWGLYQLREHVADGFLYKHNGRGQYEALKHDSEHPSVWLSPEIGTRDGWDSTLVQLARLNMATAEGAESAAKLFDIDEMIDYWIHNIITGNIDWPYNNTHVFRRLDSDDRRWRWVTWDLDPTYYFIEHNTLAWSLRDTVRNDLKWNYRAGVMEDHPHQVVSTLPMRLLLRSPEIRDRFVARTQVLLQLHYTEAATRKHLQRILDSHSPALERDAARWGWTMDGLTEQIELMERFARERPQHVREHLATLFDLDDQVRVRIHNPDGLLLEVERYPLPAGMTDLTLMRGTRLQLTVPDADGSRASRVLLVQSDTSVLFGESDAIDP